MIQTRSSRIHTEAPIPPPPPTNSPGNTSPPGPVLSALTPTFSWNAVSGATGYGLFVRDIGSNALVYNSDVEPAPLTGTSFTMPSGRLQAGREYRWNMTSLNDSGESGVSTTRYFQKKMGILAEYADKKQVADEFRVSERTIERWVRLRLLPAPVRLGRTSLFHLPTIKRHLESLSGPSGRRRGRQE